MTLSDSASTGGSMYEVPKMLSAILYFGLLTTDLYQRNARRMEEE